MAICITLLKEMTDEWIGGTMFRFPVQFSQLLEYNTPLASF